MSILKSKYKNELKKIANIEQKEIKFMNVNKLNKKQLIDELTYIYNRLPAIGFIILGIEKEIGII